MREQRILWGGQTLVEEKGPGRGGGPSSPRPLRRRGVDPFPPAADTHPRDRSTPDPAAQCLGPPGALDWKGPKRSKREPPARDGVAASTAHPGCASRNHPPSLLGRAPPSRAALHRPASRPRARRRLPGPGPGPQPGGLRPPAGPRPAHPGPHAHAARPPAGSLPPSPGRPRLPSASLPLPAAPPVPRGRRPGGAPACAGREGRMAGGREPPGVCLLGAPSAPLPGAQREDKSRILQPGWLRSQGYYETISQALKPRLGVAGPPVGAGWGPEVQLRAGGGRSGRRLRPRHGLRTRAAAAFASLWAPHGVPRVHSALPQHHPGRLSHPSPRHLWSLPEASPVSEVFSPACRRWPLESLD